MEYLNSSWIIATFYLISHSIFQIKSEIAARRRKAKNKLFVEMKKSTLKYSEEKPCKAGMLLEFMNFVDDLNLKDYS